MDTLTRYYTKGYYACMHAYSPSKVSSKPLFDVDNVGPHFLKVVFHLEYPDVSNIVIVYYLNIRFCVP